MTDPDPASAQVADFGRALVAARSGRVADALQAMQRVVDRTVALRLDTEPVLRLIETLEGTLDRLARPTGPATGVLYTVLGTGALAAGQIEVAIACGAAAVARLPDDAAAHHIAGAALAKAGRAAEALDPLIRATELAPGMAIFHQTLGETLQMLGRSAAAIESLGIAVRIDPSSALAYFSLAHALSDDGQAAQALAALDRARACHPAAASASMLRATNLLKVGRLAEGFAEYEARPLRPVEAFPGSQIPEWTGGPVAGRRILLVSEQGLGDRMQFVRYAALLQVAGAWVAVACQPALARLFQRARGVDQALAYGTPAPELDLWAPLMSLPHRLGTTAETVPAPIPYLSPEPDRVEHWRAWLDGVAGPGPALRVGLAWQGNPHSGSEAGRSIPLAELAPLARLPAVRLVSLQQQHGLDQLAAWPAELPLAQPGPGFDAGPDAFIDTAALMASLDLVVTTDTAVAHLAGALGRPVWVLLQRHAEWRWMEDRPDSPWYPTMTLFRQTRPGDWAGVVARLARALAARRP